MTLTALEKVRAAIWAGAVTRRAVRPEESANVPIALTFELGMLLALYHPEYAQALAMQIEEKQRVGLKGITDSLVRIAPIEAFPIEAEPPEQGERV